MPEFKPFLLSDAIGAGQNLAMNNLRLDEGIRHVQSRNALTAALQEGTPEAMGQYRQQYPTEAAAFDSTQATANIQKLKLASDRADFMGRLAQGVTDEPSYQRALQQAKEAGVDVTGAPPNFDQNFVKQFAEQAFSTKDRLNMGIKQAELAIKRATQREQERHNKVMEGIKSADKKKEADRSNPANMNAVRRASYDALGLTTDSTGQLIAGVDVGNVKIANDLAARAQRIYLDNPGISPAEAARRAKSEMDGAPKQIPNSPKERVKGTVYQTPKGPMTWTGTGWIPANGA